ncbi:hypothetical protein Hanom_Chr16g01489671 [Helianthus anomalus]
MTWNKRSLSLKKGKITSFVLYLSGTLQAVSFFSNVDRRCLLVGILLQVLSFPPNLVKKLS